MIYEFLYIRMLLGKWTTKHISYQYIIVTDAYILYLPLPFLHMYNSINKNITLDQWWTYRGWNIIQNFSALLFSRLIRQLNSSQMSIVEHLCLLLRMHQNCSFAGSMHFLHHFQCTFCTHITLFLEYGWLLLPGF